MELNMGKINRRKRNILEQRRKQRFYISEQFYNAIGKKLNRQEISIVQSIIDANPYVSIDLLVKVTMPEIDSLDFLKGENNV
jgi:hypothetical protein